MDMYLPDYNDLKINTADKISLLLLRKSFSFNVSIIDVISPNLAEYRHVLLMY